MTDVAILAVLQGIAEFLPISSSGHLVVAQHLLGVDEPGLRLDIALHFGTLISVFAFYRKAIWRIVRELDWRYALKIVASALPAVLAYFCFKDFIDGLFENARMVGALLMFTGAVLIGTRYMPRGTAGVGFGRAVLMGFGQALALLPGVSRSGMTIACARAGRVDPDKSAEFSFLMAAPLIIGGTMLEVVKSASAADGATEASASWWALAAGAAIAAVVGYFALAVLIRAVRGKWFWLFGPYCLAAGLATILLVR